MCNIYMQKCNKNMEGCISVRKGNLFLCIPLRDIGGECKYSSNIYFFIYNLINDIAQLYQTKIITNNMLLHVSTFTMSSSGSALCLDKIT